MTIILRESLGGKNNEVVKVAGRECTKFLVFSSALGVYGDIIASVSLNEGCTTALCKRRSSTTF